MRIVAFDIETAGPAINDRATWTTPLGVTCAATFAGDTDVPGPYSAAMGDLRRWHGAAEGNGLYPGQMTQADIIWLLAYLWQCHENGYAIVAWNSVSFDWYELFLNVKDDPQWAERVREMARASIDPAFLVICAKGYSIGLNKSAQALGVPGKLDGMTGLESITAWTESRERQDLVLQYVSQDAIATANVWQAIEAGQTVRWISSKGKPLAVAFHEVAGLTVREAVRTPHPDTAWMARSPGPFGPHFREDVAAWLEVRDAV